MAEQDALEKRMYDEPRLLYSIGDELLLIYSKCDSLGACRT
jgi:hypothetical protein